jgi:hypothetical protein
MKTAMVYARDILNITDDPRWASMAREENAKLAEYTESMKQMK